VIGGERVVALGWQYLLLPVLFNALLLLAAALVINNLLPGRHYPRLLPQELERGADDEAEPRDRLGLRRQDLHAALRGYGHLVDVSNEELDEIVEQAEQLAFRRAFGELACADIMTHAAFTVRPETSLLEAWRMLRRHRLVMLLVVDSLTAWSGCWVSRISSAPPRPHGVRLARPHPPPAALQLRPRRLDRLDHAPRGADRRRRCACRRAGGAMSRGDHLAAVVDGERRLVGVITQSDLISALYRGCGTVS